MNGGDTITEERSIWIWKLLDPYGNIKNWGVVNEPIDIFVENIIPEDHSSIDRNLSEIQDYIDKHHSEKGYIFSYEEFVIDMDNMTVKVHGE